ncbi:MAG: DUF2065 domain-containing protein [Hyphomicrobiales bacterium]|nr:DUF2065 domain-containing protein [Hyphomicrobiales bacterium]
MTNGPGGGDFLTALGLVLAIEGAAYALAPGLMKRMIEAARLVDAATFRLGGLAALVAGVGLVWLARG